MVTTGDDDAALHSCADTLAESDDEIEFGDSPTPPISSGEKWRFVFKFVIICYMGCFTWQYILQIKFTKQLQMILRKLF